MYSSIFGLEHQIIQVTNRN